MKKKNINTNKKQNKNIVVNSIDKAINEDRALNAKMENLQRVKDLKLNKIDRRYTNRIDKILRKLEVNKAQMKLAREYSNKKLGDI